ncbi:AAA ATPase domain-containing protein [Micromonospora rhizosphaerae]|uniref:AAA ATPase domain-containing protein n=1 Tax=Micromonospora rhizosphaerae TaxID=568872 RepID=A0A1C6S909_9ACTN|nr:ATP-binding protein [Micromonospora rhizosphaerae]SCL25874.1 AAA ATPase domain-containing protein [Micromonospora rhizosphaerae]
MMIAMAHEPGLELTKDLSDALSSVLGAAPTTPAPVVVLAAYLDSLAKGYGLSESLELDVGLLERVDLPASAVALINHYLASGGASLDEDSLRDRLYSVFADLSQDRRARSILNKSQPLSELGLLHLGQIYWNLEATQARPKLPIRPGQVVTVAGKQVRADIKAPNANKDFATMKWAARVNEQGPYKSSGQGFRKQGARLAVLAAEHIIKCNPQRPPTLVGAALQLTPSDRGEHRISSIIWREDEPGLATPATIGADRHRRGLDAGKQGAPDHRSVVEHSFARLKLASAFEGREPELDELVEFCTTDDEQRLLVVGERYSGKSALMAEFFVNAEASDAVRLGYFVPPNQRQDARSEAMVRHLVRQAYLLTTGEELHTDSSNPGRLRELLATCVGQARQDGRNVVLIVDGIDEDVSNRLQEQTMMSVLGELSVPRLKVIVSAWSDRIPEAAAGWRQLPVRRTEYVAECLKQMEAELESLFDQAPTRGILQYLTFGFGAFQADELAQLTGGSVRAIRKTLTGSEERVFSAVREPGEADGWAFAHPKYAEVARALFDESAGGWPAGELTSAAAVSAETETEIRVEAWAGSFRNAGWPTETPRYLLTSYPESLAERGDLARLCGLLFDPGYLRAVAGRFGPANPIPFLVDQAMPLALRAAETGGSTASLESIAKLVTVRDNYQVTADTLPLVLLEAVGRVEGPVAAKGLATHIVGRNIDYDPGEVSGRSGPFEPLSSSAAQTISALVGAGLTDMAKEYTVTRDDPDVRRAYVRALLHQGDQAGATEAARAWQSSMEDAAKDHQSALGDLSALMERALGRLVEGEMEDAAKDDPSTLGALMESVLALLAEGGDETRALAPSLVGVRDGFRNRSRCVRLFREAGDHVGASGLAMRLLGEYRTVEHVGGVVALDVAEALVWGGHVQEAWELIRTIPEVVGELATTLLGRPGIAEHPFLFPGPRILDLLKMVPTLPLIEAFLATGNHASARQFLAEHVQGKEYVQIHAALMVKAGMPDEAFTAIDTLDTLPDNTRGLEVSRPFMVTQHKVVLLALLACEHPESGAASRAVDQIKKLVADSHPEAQPVLLSQLALAMIALRRDDEFDSIAEQLEDPGDVLLHGVETAARRGDLQAVLRYVHHQQWMNPRTSVKNRIPALALAAICHLEANDPQQARKALGQALTLAASPAVATRVRRQGIVDAGVGREFDWEHMLRQGIKTGLETVRAAAYWLENPEEHLDALAAAIVAAMKLWKSSQGIGDRDEDGQNGPPGELPESGLDPLEAAIGGRAPVSWGGWPQVFAALADATNRAGDEGAAAGLATLALRAALVQRQHDDPGRPSPPVVLGYLLIDLVRLVGELEPDGIRQTQKALEDSPQRLRLAFAPFAPPREFSALWAAAESMSRAAIGQRDDARALVTEASSAVATAKSTDALSKAHEGALALCVETLAFLGEPDLAAPLLGYISDASVAAQANLCLADGYLDKGDTVAAFQYASRGLSDCLDPRILRRVDPDLVPKIAGFEDQLWKANSGRSLD